MPILDFARVELFFNFIAIIDQFSAFFAHRAFTMLVSYSAHSYTTKMICVNYRLGLQIHQPTIHKIPEGRLKTQTHT